MKGEEIVVFNVRRIFPLADYFVIVTTRSRLHAQSLCSEIEHRLKEKGLLLSGMEGYEEQMDTYGLRRCGRPYIPGGGA